MRRNNTLNPKLAKQIARQKYAERQIDNWIKWSIESRGKLLFKELVEMQNKYGINCHG
jgi:hypothetical protein